MYERIKTGLFAPAFFELFEIEDSWVAVNPSTDYGVVRDTKEAALGALLLESGLMFEFLEVLLRALA